MSLSKTFLKAFKSRKITPQLVVTLKSLGIFRARGKSSGSKAKPSFNSSTVNDFVSPSQPRTIDPVPPSSGNKFNRIVHNITLANVNARSLRNKIGDLQWWMDIHKTDIVSVTETWFSKQDCDDAFAIPGFQLIRKDRSSTKKGGGVACFIRDDWILQTLQLNVTEPEGVDSVWCWCRPRFLPRRFSGFIVGTIYSPPNITFSAAKRIVEFVSLCIDQAKCNHGDAKTIVAGDFNQWDVKGISSCCSLSQIVNVPTRFENTLDLVFTDIPSLSVSTFEPLGNGDHSTVIARLDVSFNESKEPKSKVIVVQHRPDSAIRQCGSSLATLDWSYLYNMTDVNIVESNITSTLQKVVNEFFTPKQLTIWPRSKPWMSSNILKLLSDKRKAWKRKDQSAVHLLNKQVQFLIQKEKKKYIERVVQPTKHTNPRKWFSHVKKLGGLSNHKETTTENQFSPDELNNFFISLCSPCVNPPPVLPSFLPANKPLFLTPLLVSKLLTRIKCHKSQPQGDIPNFFVKEYALLIAEPISYLFNLSISQGKIPSNWSIAEVVPLPKVDKPSDCKHFRPISKFPVLFRVLEKFIADRIRPAILQSIDDSQFGGLPGRSTSHFLIALLESIFKILESKGLMASLLLTDFEKAFNRIVHHLCVESLCLAHIDSNWIQWIHSFLANNSQVVLYNNSLSLPASVPGGLPQGTSLGPALFILVLKNCPGPEFSRFKFIDDLASVVDDSSIIPTGINAQDSLSQIFNWCQTNYMKLNLSKCSVLHFNFSKKTPLPLPSPGIGGTTIDTVDHVKILGVHFHCSLKWDLQVEEMVKKASKLLFVLRKLSFAQFDNKSLVAAFSAFIRPIVEYAVPVWAPGLTTSQSDLIEGVQKRACRIILNDYSSPYETLLQKLDLKSLSERRNDTMLKFAQKLAKHPIYSNWFPPTNIEVSGRSTRASNKIWTQFVSTERRKKSPMVLFAKLLNDQ